MEDGSNLVNHFWRVLSVNFEREIREATKGSGKTKSTFVSIQHDIYPCIFSFRLLTEHFGWRIPQASSLSSHLFLQSSYT